MIHDCRVILVRAENPANIGQVARAMKNFGFSNLALVTCASHQTHEAYTLGWKSKEILDRAQSYSSLKDAIQGTSLVVGFTRRSGRHRGQGRLIADAIPQIMEASRSGLVALVFGNEKNGLSNEELKYCDDLVIIPTASAYSSLNLSHAIAIALYSIYSQTLEGKKINKKPERFYTTPKEFEELMNDFRTTLIALGYQKSLRENLLETTLVNIKHFFKKCSVEKREFHLFKAFLAKVRGEREGQKVLRKNLIKSQV